MTFGDVRGPRLGNRWSLVTFGLVVGLVSDTNVDAAANAAADEAADVAAYTSPDKSW